MKWLSEFYCNYSKGNRRGAVCVLAYRIAHFCSVGKRKFIGLPFILFYHFFFRIFLGFDIHEKCKIGERFCVWHCFGIAINPNVIIGDDCSMGHNTTIGSKIVNNEIVAPIIGNNVQISPSSCIIGNIKIGNDVIIGIGAVVVKNIPSGSVVVGNPAKIICTNRK